MNKTRWFGLRPHLILEKKRKNVCLPLPLTAFSTHEGTTPRVIMSYWTETQVGTEFLVLPLASCLCL